MYNGMPLDWRNSFTACPYGWFVFLPFDNRSSPHRSVGAGLAAQTHAEVPSACVWVKTATTSAARFTYMSEPAHPTNTGSIGQLQVGFDL
jgi:hypothetical protein